MDNHAKEPELSAPEIAWVKGQVEARAAGLREWGWRNEAEKEWERVWSAYGPPRTNGPDTFIRGYVAGRRAAERIAADNEV